MRKRNSIFFESLQIIALFIGVIGTLAVPGMPEASGLLGTSYISADITEDVEMVSLLLPGSENLDEKSIPLSKLAGDHSFSLAGLNLLETTPTEIVVKLPGTKNLAEKRIPDPVLQKLYQRYQVD